jgi:hypothetical protein
VPQSIGNIASGPYGYAHDWAPAAEPHISPAHGSEFVRRGIAIRNGGVTLTP